jgi:Zn-dependent peptidase ImmA (M78 family)
VTDWTANLNRMELADLGNPEALAAKIIELVPEAPIPIPLPAIAERLGINEIRYEPTDAFDGCLVCLPGKTHGGIIVNSRQRPTRRRFSLGHELGHWLIPTHTVERQKFVCSSRDFAVSGRGTLSPAQRMEWEANRFSAHLLLPTKLVSRALQRIRGFDLTHLLSLADDFATSKEFTALRYTDLSEEPCCFVTSRDGVIRRVYPTERFPSLRVWRGDQVPSRSQTIRTQADPGWVSDLDEVDSAEWLETQYGRKTPSVFEQVHIQEGGYRLTFLTIEWDEDEEPLPKPQWHSRR